MLYFIKLLAGFMLFYIFFPLAKVILYLTTWVWLNLCSKAPPVFDYICLRSQEYVMNASKQHKHTRHFTHTHPHPHTRFKLSYQPLVAGCCCGNKYKLTTPSILFLDTGNFVSNCCISERLSPFDQNDNLTLHVQNDHPLGISMLEPQACTVSADKTSL